jgi:hypothetical protein
MKKGRSTMEEMKVKMVFEHDTKRYHRYKIKDPKGQVMATVYISRDVKQVPKRVTLEVENK